ncbi:integration host factor subunit alpha [Desulfogranum japonicum]|uniref:integration host factor subunit alpha n=1 Tax=Desulfogranum japonicum TaxID=231447 RepID=UPI0004055348|nr:integration host factor subunit alpha [Desulfogranum japonicum]
MKLTKAIIANEIRKANNKVSTKEASKYVETFLAIVKQDIVAGNDLLISGFGKFVVRDKRQRRGRNPQTGDALLLDPRRVVTFHSSVKLREKVNGDVVD